MNEVLALIVSASVLMGVGLMVILMGTSSLTDINEQSSNLQDTKCKIQVDKCKAGEVTIDQVSQSCRDQAPSRCQDESSIIREAGRTAHARLSSIS